MGMWSLAVARLVLPCVLVAAILPGITLLQIEVYSADAYGGGGLVVYCGGTTSRSSQGRTVSGFASCYHLIDAINHDAAGTFHVPDHTESLAMWLSIMITLEVASNLVAYVAYVLYIRDPTQATYKYLRLALVLHALGVICVVVIHNIQLALLRHLATTHCFKQQSTMITWWVYIILAIPLIELLMDHQTHWHSKVKLYL
jgi:hypothetical protein